jgi:hypothetical protein
MISSITSSMSAIQRPAEKTLTSDQSSKLTEILSKFDAEKLSASDAKSIVEQVKELEIQPGKALAKAMETAGFDAKAIGDLAKPEQTGTAQGGKGGPDGSRPPPPPGGGQGGGGEGGISSKGTVDSTAATLLAEVIDSYGGSDMTEETWAEAMASLSEQGVDLTKSIMDLRV